MSIQSFFVLFLIQNYKKSVEDKQSHLVYHHQWKITATAYPFTLSFNNIYEEIFSIWEYNIEQYGNWRWGDL